MERYLYLMMLAAALAVLAIYDHRENLLPDRLTLPLVWAGLLYSINSGVVPVEESVYGAASGYLAIRVIHDARLAASGYSGIGLGDAKLLAALGSWLGWKPLAFILVTAAVFTLAVYAKQDRKMPLGVGLSVSGVLVAAWKYSA